MSSEVFQPLIEVVRGDLLESVHFGAVAVVDSDLELVAIIGDVDRSMYPRSAAKLLQASAMLQQGLEVTSEQLALVASSHSGGDTHVKIAAEILQRYGLDFSHLQCTPFAPSGAAERLAYRKAGGTIAAERSDCSGKHAGMLATCVINGWDTSTYLDANHPLQLAIRSEIEAVTQMRISHTTVDGCGAPLFSSSLHGFAVAFAKAVTQIDSPLQQVADAMRKHPEVVGGPAREVTEVMRSMPGLLAKDGADGVFVMAHRDHGAVAFKIADGGFRGLNALARFVLGRWGVTEIVPEMREFRIEGAGRVVGEIRPSRNLLQINFS